jgi:hypothetical protein
MLASHRCGSGSIEVQLIWDLWWTEWQWSMFSKSISVSIVSSYSTNCSKLIIIHRSGLLQQAD